METKPNLKDVILKSQIDEKDILAIFQWGSRVYGVSNKDSDWDFMVIVKDSCQIPETDTREDWINVHVIHLQEILKRQEENELQSLMLAFLPSEFVWLNLVPKLHTPEIQLPKILKAVHKEASRHFHTGAKRLFNEGAELYKSKKWITYAFRDFIFGIQLAKHKKIVDFSAANELYHQIMAEQATDWAFYQQKYDPLFYQLKTEFEKAIDPKGFLKERRNSLLLLDLLEDGVTPQKLKEEFGILTVQNGNLFLFFTDPSLPFDYANILQSELHSGLIVENSKDSWKVCSSSFPLPIPSNLNHLFSKMNENSLLIYPSPLGTRIHLYYHNQKWCVSSSSELEISPILLSQFWSLWKEQNFIFPNEKTCQNFCLGEKLYLLSSRNLESQQELDIVNATPISSLYQAIEKSLRLNPFTYDGFFLLDQSRESSGAFRRIKIISPLFDLVQFCLHHSPDPKKHVSLMLEWVSHCEPSWKPTFLSLCPAWTSLFQEVDSKYSIVLNTIQNLYEQIQNQTDSKLFSQTISQPPFRSFQSLFFRLRKEGVSDIADFLRSLFPLDLIHKMIKI